MCSICVQHRKVRRELKVNFLNGFNFNALFKEWVLNPIFNGRCLSICCVRVVYVCAFVCDIWWSTERGRCDGREFQKPFSSKTNGRGEQTECVYTRVSSLNTRTHTARIHYLNEWMCMKWLISLSVRNHSRFYSPTNSRIARILAYTNSCTGFSLQSLENERVTRGWNLRNWTYLQSPYPVYGSCINSHWNSSTSFTSSS